jgi:polyhydroxyalkanoate synthase
MSAPKITRHGTKTASDKAVINDTPGESSENDANVRMAANFTALAEQSQKVVAEFTQRTLQGVSEGKSTSYLSALNVDPTNVSKAFQDLFVSLAAHPEKLFQAQMDLWQSHMQLWQNTARQIQGETVEPIIEPKPRDKRFRDPDWQENFVFNYLKQSYLLTSKWLQQTVASADGLSEHDRKKIDFYTQQYIDAMSPSNFMMTNPEVLRETMTSNGENLLRGLNNLLRDFEKGDGTLKISQVDMEYFELGKNIATTPGKVVFQNEILQLIQYSPTTEKVHKTPLLILPPWINKFYVLDLSEKNSFIRWIVDQGYTVFITSWVNPDRSLADKSLDDYMTEGILAAIGAVQQATGVEKVNTIGYCIGGTLLGATLAYMAKKELDLIESATFFTAQVDFSEAGDLLVFIDEEQLDSLEEQIEESGGYLEGTSMANTFNMLRSNDLIWSYVVNNYLLGKDPARFDILYWNADATRMPKNLHMAYLRECYLNNNLSQGKMKLDGETLDLADVKVPVFLQSGREDHIAPYGSVYKASHLYGGPVTFMLAGSGHIAGVINPPSANKYMYWTNDDVSGDVDAWLSTAKEHPGSWWPYWEEWLRQRSGTKVKARIPGSGKLEVIEDAPGSYVKVRS